MKFLTTAWFYLWQPAMAFIYMFCVLIAFGMTSASIVLGAIGASSLGASSLIVFTHPHAKVAKFINMLGGYSIGILSGVTVHYLAQVGVLSHVHLTALYASEISAAFAVAMAIFLMALFHMHHPPAAGLALGLVLEPWDDWTIAIVFVAVIVVSFVRYLLGPYMRTLP